MNRKEPPIIPIKPRLRRAHGPLRQYHLQQRRYPKQPKARSDQDSTPNPPRPISQKVQISSTEELQKLAYFRKQLKKDKQRAIRPPGFLPFFEWLGLSNGEADRKYYQGEVALSQTIIQQQKIKLRNRQIDYAKSLGDVESLEDLENRQHQNPRTIVARLIFYMFFLTFFLLVLLYAYRYLTTPLGV